jgi:hypothetical protein
MSDQQPKSPLLRGPAGNAGVDDATAQQFELNTLTSALAAHYREQLLALRSERAAVREHDDDADDLVAPDSKRWLDAEEAADVRSLFREAREKAEQRKYQLSLFKKYLVDPSRLLPDGNGIPSSTTLDEFEERKRDLEFRVSLLKALLAMAEEEYALLLQGEAYARAHQPAAPTA